MLTTGAGQGRGRTGSRRRVTDEGIRDLALSSLRRAGRPRGSHPAVIAEALGILGLPCAPEDVAALEGATSDAFRYPWLQDEGERRSRVFAGLASSLLQRTGRPHLAGDVAALAHLLEARPDVD